MSELCICPLTELSFDIALAVRQTLRVPSGEGFASGVTQSQAGESVGDPRCPELAESALVSRSERDPGGSSLADSPQEGLTVSRERRDMAHQPGVVEA